MSPAHQETSSECITQITSTFWFSLKEFPQSLQNPRYGKERLPPHPRWLFLLEFAFLFLIFCFGTPKERMKWNITYHFAFPRSKASMWNCKFKLGGYKIWTKQIYAEHHKGDAAWTTLGVWNGCCDDKWTPKFDDGHDGRDAWGLWCWRCMSGMTNQNKQHSYDDGCDFPQNKCWWRQYKINLNTKSKINLNTKNHHTIINNTKQTIHTPWAQQMLKGKFQYHN